MRVGRKLGEHLEVNVGVAVHVLASLTGLPRWDSAQTVPTGSDGIGAFGNDSTAGSIVVSIAPGIGVAYEF